MIRRIKLSTVALFCPLLFSFQGFAQQQTPTGTVTPPAVVIASGDVIDILNLGNPDLSGRFRVDEKGDVQLPFIHSVHVAGLSAAEVGPVLEVRYVEAEILKQPQIVVQVAESRTQGVTVVGEAKTPGVYPALGVRMLNDIMTAAGGLTISASENILIRRNGDPNREETVRYNPSGPQISIPQVQVFPGDLVIVPKAGVIYAVGNVSKPGVFVIESQRTPTLAALMVLAGDGGHGAALTSVRVFSPQPNGERVERVFNYKAITRGKAPDVVLHDGDIVYVPTSGLKIASERAIELAFTIGTTIALYHVQF